MSTEALISLLAEFQRDRLLAHAVLFDKRHPHKTPAFHKHILDAWASDHPRVLIEAFRGAAKSTLAEEALILGALLKEFNFALIVGNSAAAACQRLASIKYELENNEKIEAMFGSVVGATWNQDEIVLTNGVRIKALGRGQSPRGAKDDSSNKRPDLILIDDLEDADSVNTPEARDKAWYYLTRELIPAADDPVHTRIRFNGTPLHEDAVLERLAKTGKWMMLKFPLYIDNPDGSKRPTWASRFPLEVCMQMYDAAAKAGDLAGFSQEYLCQSMSNDARTFRPEYIKTAHPAQVPLWAPKILVVDPARTTKATSARTGYTVFSWLGNQLWVFEAIGAFHSPAEQVDTIFRLNEEYSPMQIGVEADGLEEWLMQPLRAEQARRGIVLPLEAVRAPKDKKSFIKGLQPFFVAGEVTFCKELPDLHSELLSFPVGKVDVVNSLAYALKIRPGAPVYPMFSAEHVLHRNLNPLKCQYWLTLNATPGTLFGVFVAVQEGAVHVLRDWVLEGPMEDGLRQIVMDLRMKSSAPFQMCVPKDRMQPGDATALIPALRRAGLTWREGRRGNESVECLTELLRNREGHLNLPRLTVAPEATWTLNALAGGYARSIDAAQHVVSAHPTENIYSRIAQAVECMVGSIDPQLAEKSTEQLFFGQTRTGKRYLSLRR